MAEGIIKAFKAGKVDQKDVSTAILNIATVVSSAAADVRCSCVFVKSLS